MLQLYCQTQKEPCCLAINTLSVFFLKDTDDQITRAEVAEHYLSFETADYFTHYLSPCFLTLEL